jgi:hypothetical protein
VNAPRLLLAAAVGLTAGCATAPAPHAADAARPYPPLSSYAADPFVPINLYLNPNEQASGTLKMLIEHSAEQLRACGAFVRVDRGVQRWPLTLQARYVLKGDAAPGDAARRVLGALTLGLVPVWVTQEHALHAEVLAEPDSVATLELTLTVRDRVSLYDLGDAGRGERAAADTLLERLLGEIAQRKLVPRWAAFKPEPPKKKPREPEGQPT